MQKNNQPPFILFEDKDVSFLKLLLSDVIKNIKEKNKKDELLTIKVFLLHFYKKYLTYHNDPKNQNQLISPIQKSDFLRSFELYLGYELYYDTSTYNFEIRVINKLSMEEEDEITNNLNKQLSSNFFENFKHHDVSYLLYYLIQYNLWKLDEKKIEYYKYAILLTQTKNELQDLYLQLTPLIFDLKQKETTKHLVLKIQQLQLSKNLYEFLDTTKIAVFKNLYVPVLVLFTKNFKSLINEEINNLNEFKNKHLY